MSELDATQVTPSGGRERDLIDAALADAISPHVPSADLSPGRPAAMGKRVHAGQDTLRPAPPEEAAASGGRPRTPSDEETIPFASPAGTRRRPADSNSSLPDSISGYQILKEIHRGGQGVVYQAIQKSTKRKVAVKVMKEGPFAGPSDKARFDREVQILGALHHPNIVAIHDSGEAAGHFYYVMDYISGQPLDVWMASGPRNIDETLTIFAKICDAVSAAHLRGVVHRDLKPGNIRVDADREPHVLDFGLAKLTGFDSGDGDHGHPVSITGQFIGSVPWASPEQAEGIPGKIDIRTDVYSLGVLLYQMLTGRFPYEVVGNIRDVLDRIIRAEPARPSTVRRQINNEVETIVLKCLAKERERRYQSAGELARDVYHYLRGEAIEAKRDSLLYVVRKRAFQNAYTTTVALLGVVIIFGFLMTCGFFLRGRYEAERERDRLAALAAEQMSLNRASVHGFLTQTKPLALGWFLAEWYAGRTERARAIRDQFDNSSPEYAVTAYLLDEGYTTEWLMADLAGKGPHAVPLGLFATGERCMRAGRTAEAIRAFESIRLSKDTAWLFDTAQARLAVLRAQEPRDD